MLDLIKKYLDPGTTLVVLTTLGLFIAALFVKGLTHDILLGTGVFLVSVKLIILNYKNTKGVEAIQDKLDIFLRQEKNLEKALITIKKNQASEPGFGREKGDSPGK
jgi:low affinity Fe/Cu permease